MSTLGAKVQMGPYVGAIQGQLVRFRIDTNATEGTSLEGGSRKHLVCYKI